MCNLYSLTKGQGAIIALVRAMRDRTGKSSTDARDLSRLSGTDRAHCA